jgi:hypothetical protein
MTKLRMIILLLVEMSKSHYLKIMDILFDNTSGDGKISSSIVCVRASVWKIIP